MTRAEAYKRVHELGLDADVRTVAETGRHDEADINCLIEWEGLEVRAEAGAGRDNSAQVARIDTGQILYDVSKFGLYVSIFHEGPWVERIQYFAQIIREAKAQQEREEEERKRREEENLFTPTDF